MSDLLPCPFCGASVEPKMWEPSFDGQWAFACGTDGCPMFGADQRYMTRVKAIAAWNRRAAPPSPRAPDEAALERMACEVYWRITPDTFTKSNIKAALRRAAEKE